MKTIATLAAALALAGCTSFKRDTTVLLCYGPCSAIPQAATAAASSPTR